MELGNFIQIENPRKIVWDKVNMPGLCTEELVRKKQGMVSTVFPRLRFISGNNLEDESHHSRIFQSGFPQKKAPLFVIRCELRLSIAEGAIHISNKSKRISVSPICVFHVPRFQKG